MSQTFSVSIRDLIAYIDELDLDYEAKWKHLKDIAERQDRVAEQRNAPVQSEQNGAEMFAKEVICPVCGHIVSVYDGNKYALNTPNHRSDEPFCKSSNMAILPRSNRSDGGSRAKRS